MSDIPRRILTDEFHQIIAGRRLRAAVFLTFRFDPGFFEQEVLPAFLDAPLSHVPEIRLLNLEDALRRVDSIAVYYDRRGLIAGAQSGKLDVERIAVSHPTGYFHPKNVLALVEDESEDAESRLSLIVAAMSANLTRAGWWENVEVAHITEVSQDTPCSFKDDVLTLIRRVRNAAPRDQSHQALDWIEKFVRRVPAEEQRVRNNVLLPRLFAHESVIEFLTDDLKARGRLQGCNLEVLSPYFDDTAASAGPLEQLHKTFNPREIRVFLPRGLENEALCSSEYYARVSALAKWASLPGDVMKLSKTNQRTLHAKVYRFFDRQRGYEAFFVGSVNLTAAAFARGGNLESGFFIETDSPPRRTLDWWLTPDEKPPINFAKREEGDGLVEGPGWKLSLRFDWSSETADVFWDDRAASPELTLLANGVQVGSVPSLPPRERKALPQELSRALLDVLRSTSFLTVRIAGEEDAEILVEEIHMTHKPSLMKSLSAADILRYWSLLTPEQKKEFLDEHASDLVDDPELALWISSAKARTDTDTFFSTFAQIYLSFGNVERAVRDALESGREREAVDRLFGRKFDSLRRLVDRISEESESDAVRNYVTLLCARQLLDSLASSTEAAEFMIANRTDVKDLRLRIEQASTIKERLDIGGAAEREKFFPWFEKWFLTRAQPKESSAE